MKKKIVSILLAVLVCASLLTTVALADGGAALSAAGASGQPGQQVSVVVSLSSNPGIGTLTLNVSYDSAVLEPVSYDVSGLGGSPTVNMEGGTVVWYSTTNTAYTGAFLTLTFKILESAQAGATATVSVSGTASANTEDGLDEEAVSLSGASATVTVEAAVCDHNYDTTLVNAKAATCTDEGYTGDKVCSNCGAVVEAGTAIPALGHTWDNGKVTKEATCTDAGEILYTCTVCGATKTEETAALGHTWDEGKVTKEATATDDGEMTYTCTVCGETMTEAIPALGESEPTDAPETSGNGSNSNGSGGNSGGNSGGGSGSGSGGNSGNGSGGSGQTSPKTGDETNLALWAVLALSCAGALAIILTGRKKREN